MVEKKQFDIAIFGIRLTIIAIAMTFCVEAISIFLSNSLVPPFLVGLVYLTMAGFLFWAFLRIRE